MIFDGHDPSRISVSYDKNAPKKRDQEPREGRDDSAPESEESLADELDESADSGR